jgi:hypothetical protein
MLRNGVAWQINACESIVALSLNSIRTYSESPYAVCRCIILLSDCPALMRDALKQSCSGRWRVVVDWGAFRDGSEHVKLTKIRLADCSGSIPKQQNFVGSLSS